MELQLSQFLPVANLIHAASKDETRYAMNGVCFNTETGNAGATDGHRMAETTIELETKGTLGSIIIDRDACEAILKAKQHGYVTLSKEKTVLKTAGRSQEWLNIDGQFPDLKQVKPKTKPAMFVGLDAALLLGLAKALRAPTNSKKTMGVKVGFTDQLSPIVVECGENYGLLMPMRLDGKMEAIEAVPELYLVVTNSVTGESAFISKFHEVDKAKGASMALDTFLGDDFGCSLKDEAEFKEWLAERSKEPVAATA